MSYQGMSEGHEVEFYLDKGDSPGLYARVICKVEDGPCKMDGTKCFVQEQYDYIGMDAFRTTDEIELATVLIKDIIYGPDDEVWIELGDVV